MTLIYDTEVESKKMREKCTFNIDKMLRNCPCLKVLRNQKLVFDGPPIGFRRGCHFYKLSHAERDYGFYIVME